MKFICQQKELFQALNVSIKAINTSNTLPILNNFYLKCEGKNILVAATNLEIAISVNFEAKVSNEGVLAIPAKLFTNYIGLLKEGDVEITDEEAVNLAIKTASTKTVIKGVKADDFPSIPKIEKEISFIISAAQFIEGINQTVFATSLNKSRPVLTGVYFEVVKDNLKMVATDSYRLSEKIIKLKSKPEKDIKCIVPAKTLMELAKIISEDNLKEVEVIISLNQILFRFNKIEFISRLIEGQFPDYKQIIPKTPKTKVNISLNDFSLAIKRINLFARENNNHIKLEFNTNNSLILTTPITQFGSEEDRLDIIIEGEENNIALNSNYLLDLFSNLHGVREIVLEVDSNLTPIKIKVPKKEDFLHIIMPLRL